MEVLDRGVASRLVALLRSLDPLFVIVCGHGGGKSCAGDAVASALSRALPGVGVARLVRAEGHESDNQALARARKLVWDTEGALSAQGHGDND